MAKEKQFRIIKKPIFILQSKKPGKQFARLVAWLLVAGWMTVIFILSHQSASISSSLSSGITQHLLEWINQIFGVMFDIHVVHFLIRKAAHFVSYLILGILTYYSVTLEVEASDKLQQFLNKTNHHKFNGHNRFMDVIYRQEVRISMKSNNLRFCILTSLAICIFYAMSDEFHQLFIPGRSGEIRDVVIDSAGSLTSIVIMMIINIYQQRKASSSIH